MIHTVLPIRILAVSQYSCNSYGASSYSSAQCDASSDAYAPEGSTTDPSSVTNSPMQEYAKPDSAAAPLITHRTEDHYFTAATVTSSPWAISAGVCGLLLLIIITWAVIKRLRR